MRLLRTICELKYINYGALDCFNIISRRLCFRDLKDEIRFLTESLPGIFLNGKNTICNEYEFGSQYVSGRVEEKESVKRVN